MAQQKGEETVDEMDENAPQPADGAIPPLDDESGAGDDLASQLSEAQDRVLRLTAEVENVRKRVQRDADDRVKYASLPLIEDLLPVLDNLDRAAESAAGESGASGLVDGVKMVVQQLIDVLDRRGCKKIAAAPGDAFDPHLHEAMLQQPSDEVPAGGVTMVMQSGFQLHERVVRPAKVIVSSGPTAAAGD